MRRLEQGTEWAGDSSGVPCVCNQPQPGAGAFKRNDENVHGYYIQNWC